MNQVVKLASDAFRAEARKTRLAELEKAATMARERNVDPEAWLEFARLLIALDRHGEAIVAFREAIGLCPASARLYWRYIVLLKELNRTEDAIRIAAEARLQFPGDFLFELKESLLLPLLYKDSEELSRYRRRYASGLSDIARRVRLDSKEERDTALFGLTHHVNFLLPYQGGDDRGLQATFGSIVCRIMAANYPQYAKPLTMPADEGKLCIGYISAHFRDHSVSKTHLGWLRDHDRERFRIFVYHTGPGSDSWTEAARRASSVFRQLPQDLEERCRTIRADELHILVFLDIGMDARTSQLAYLRLAPAQCTTWGHPATSGLPTVDYFFSSELMEPENAQSYYTEELVRLPGVGVCYSQPAIPAALFHKTRADFGIREDAIVYLSCQSLFKYLPQHDDIYPAIAKLVPSAQFVFIAMNDAVRKDFEQRLGRAFAAVEMAMATHVVFVPPLDQLSYWNLNALSDIYLDTMEWSGCNSTIEAIACKLPVVTLPGQFMRGRHSFAILTQLGVTDAIAGSKSEYVKIAARLAFDREWRIELVRRQTAGFPGLFSDQRSLRFLETFYEEIAGGRRAPRSHTEDGHND